MTATLGGPGVLLDAEEVQAFVKAQVDRLNVDGRSVCIVIPDATRQCPLPLLIGAINAAIIDRASSCTVVVALGTHAPMDDDAIRSLIGTASMRAINHTWWDENTFISVGVLAPETVGDLSGGRLFEAVDIRINRLVVESDVTLIVGPVLPHEVVGFSGGNKYLFPGLSGKDLIDITHWLGALITSSEIIGTQGITPVRALIDAAAEMVPGERHAFCVVVDHETGGLQSVAFGEPASAWASAAAVSAQTHVEYLAEPVDRVLSLVSSRYADLWTGAKGFYKVEPVVADGGEVVVFTPRITQIAATHPDLAHIGYHCRDFFLAQWDDYCHYSRGELAHSTHLFGAGTYDPIHGEKQRVKVTLATGISEELTNCVNLTYLNPASIDIADWARTHGTLVVRDAGEVLFRLR